MVLLPETDGDQAVAAANHLRALLAATPVEAGTTGIAIRASVGVAAWNAAMSAPADLYAAADVALYRA